jgi:hypothetical protein
MSSIIPTGAKVEFSENENHFIDDVKPGKPTYTIITFLREFAIFLTLFGDPCANWMHADDR